MRKLVTCNLIKNSVKPGESNDSPMQLKLIEYLGMKKFLIDKFIFRRKQSCYSIYKKYGVNTLYIDQQYSPPIGYNFETLILQTSSNSVPICKLTPQTKTNDNVIIYAHGNSSDMSNSLMFVEGLCDLISATYIVFDYSGYGESRVNDVGEQIICKDLEIVLAWATEFVSLKNIILWGFSLGTYPVTYAASKYELGGVILQCPIASISCIFYEQLHAEMCFENDHFANIDLIDKIHSNLLILHSSNDEIIPISHSKVLFDKFVKANGDNLINFIQVSKIGHNSLHKYLITQVPNQLQSQVFNFILEIIYRSDSKITQKANNKMLKTQKPNQSKMKLSQMRKSKAETSDSGFTTVSLLKRPHNVHKELQDLRMQILEADIEDVEEDLKQIIVQEIDGQVQARVSKKGTIWGKKCLCINSQAI